LRQQQRRSLEVRVMSVEPTPLEHLDVLIVGAGISGIGAAYYLQDRLPGKIFAIIEARAALGGTWDLFRYPGVRSDSDLHTFGFEFRPWREPKAIAPASSILNYLRDTASEFGIDKRIRYNQRVVGADWSSEDSRWTVHIERTDVEASGNREYLDITTDWIFSASGYYSYDKGYAPAFAGTERFGGPIIHPQFWPEHLDYAGKRIVVIGSGATAVTIIPAMADDAAHITMIQRTPSYILPIPSEDRFAARMRRLFGTDRAHPIIRRRNIAQQRLIWRLSRRFPAQMRKFIRWANTKSLPEGFPVDEHFNPPYNPWDQRLCFVPDGDFFESIRSGKASVVTDRIRTLTEAGVELESGAVVEADIIITATGLNIRPFGGARLTIDGDPVQLHDKVAYRGVMLDGVPNFAYSIGYTNASWTLKVGLLCEYFTRLLTYMDAHGSAVCYPERPSGDFATRPLLDFGAGYVQRAIDDLPRQGSRSPWATSMDYYADVRMLRKSPIADRNLYFAPTRHGSPTAKVSA
jgi:cation diffusion facilitator CzcD-associated flavoprotein CzcO